jgi:hypothetical protein
LARSSFGGIGKLCHKPEHLIQVDMNRERREPVHPLMDKSDMQVRSVWMCLVLAGLRPDVFWPVVHCQFANFENSSYVTANPNVLGGLALENLGWAFRIGCYHANTELNRRPVFREQIVRAGAEDERSSGSRWDRD